MPSTKTALLQPIPYLAFDGNCAEAMGFYAKVLGGSIKFMMTAAESPMADQVPEGYKNSVLNCQMELPGGMWIYGGDYAPPMVYQGSHGFSLTLNYESVEEAEETFNQFAEGGEVTMPFAPTFWADKFGMVKDKFGINWSINGVLKKM